MTLHISVPEELYRKAVEIAAAEHVSVEEVFTSAFAGQLDAWERLKARAARGTYEKFRAVMKKVPAAEPEECDRL